MINWKAVLELDELAKEDMASFASGECSGRQVYNAFKGTEVGGEVRKLLRENGVTKARNLTRKALKRRGVTVVIED